MIDSHCHIQFNGFKDDYNKVVARCVEKNCTLITVGTQKDTSKKAIEFSDKFDNVYTTVGLHPIHQSSTEIDEEETSFVSREEEFDYEYYKKLSQHPKVVGIGECGIELFHIPKNSTKQEIIEKQRPGFEAQIDLAVEIDLPMTIHVRDAYDEVIEILGNKKGVRGVIHCFSGNWKQATQLLDMGFYLGFTGIITFPPRKTNPQSHLDLIDVVKKCPINKILAETDAPYLAPQKYRGKKCEPWMVEEIIAKIAEIKEMAIDEVAKMIESNTRNLYTKIT